MSESCVDLIPSYFSQIEIKTSSVTHNTPLCLDKGTSLTTVALKSTVTKAHQNIYVHTLATTKNLNLDQIGNESITPPQSLPKKSTLPYLKRKVVNTYKKRAPVHTLKIRAVQIQQTINSH